MPAKPLVQKLFIRENYTVLLLNAPGGYAESLADLPSGAQVVTKATKQVDVIQIFAATKEEMTKLFRRAKPLLKPDGLLWATYPKGGQMNTDLKREVIWECGETVGMSCVAQIAVDDVWSAMRFKMV
jgi:hypothetical protein